MKIDDRPIRKDTRTSQSPSTARYEYRSLALSLNTGLTEYSEQGWELVSVVGIGADVGWFYFRRELK